MTLELVIRDWQIICVNVGEHAAMRISASKSPRQPG